MTQVTIEQATQRLAKLVDAAIEGEEVIVVRGEQPAVRLVPIGISEAHPQFGSGKGLFTMSDDFDDPLDDFREYMG